MPFSIEGFEQISFTPRTASRNFPLCVESYDTEGDVHFVLGVDMSSGIEQRRVRVYLREMKKESTGGSTRAGVIHYATDPFAGLTEADYRDRNKMDRINSSLEAKCFTAPGGVLMVQSAHDDPNGAVSAYWLNRVLGSINDLTDGTAAIVSPAVARLSTPAFPRDGETGLPYCYCDVLHVQNTTAASSPKQMEELMFNALSVPPTGISGRCLVAIRLIDKATGLSSTKLLDRRQEKDSNGNYTNESPAASIDRFWKAMPDSFASGLKESMLNKKVEALVIPGTRYPLVGDTLKAVTKPKEKRMGLPYERFNVPNNLENGFLSSTVVLKRHKSSDSRPDADGSFFITGVYPMANNGEAVSLTALAL